MKFLAVWLGGSSFLYKLLQIPYFQNYLFGIAGIILTLCYFDHLIERRLVNFVEMKNISSDESNSPHLCSGTSSLMTIA